MCYTFPITLVDVLVNGCQCGEQVLSGWFELTIDSKNRVSVPHPVRAKLNADTDGTSFYVLPGHRRGTLAIYPDRYFEKLRRRPPPRSNSSEAVHEWRQFEFSQTFLIDPDNQGRILIPERLLKRAGIGKDVTLIGVDDHLELWPRETYDAFVAEKWPEYPAHRNEAEDEYEKQHPPAGREDGLPNEV